LVLRLQPQACRLYCSCAFINREGVDAFYRLGKLAGDGEVIARSTKPNRCQHCKARMPDDKARHVLHEECIEPWLEKQHVKKLAKRKADLLKAKRIEKAVDRKKREAQKTLPVLKAEAQTAFNAWTRARDVMQPCISCGKPPGDVTQLHAGRDAGHYRSVGSAPHVRYDERNVHAQCVSCNQYGAGRAVEYRQGLIVRIGLANVEALEAEQGARKWGHDELRAIKTKYAAMTKQLKREMG